jgi:serine/threonine protein kinase
VNHERDRWSEFLSTPIDAVAAGVIGQTWIGRRFGNYEIAAPLGAGGMGEVYRARDHRLGRDVAIKVLPPAFVADHERLARFEREARILAALNHPHIATIYSIEDVDDASVLVLELVDGETLTHRLLRGPIPVGEALPIARQIAEALEAAHEKGIIHRDLKPANVAITADGVVKVLDFGLAKGDATAADASQSPTLTVGGTRDGVLLGTAAYMSPEQARGQAVDKRTDIWAFGCVFYEMLTGGVPFCGNTTSDHIAAILGRDPDYSALPSRTPPPVRRLLRRCLEKDLKRRLPDIAIARLEIDEPSDDVASTTSSVPRATRAIWAVAAALFAGGLVLDTVIRVIWRDRPPDTVVLELQAPEGHRFLGLPGAMAISPDGQHVVFPAVPANTGVSSSELGVDATGLRRADGALLYIRALSTPPARPLAGTDGGTFPTWSPDGRFVAFVCDGVLKKISVTDGSMMKLADDAEGRPTWGLGGIVLFTGADGRLHRVSENGGVATVASELDKSHGEFSHNWPVFLPDGKRFIYLARSQPLTGSAVYLSSIDSTARTQVFRANTSVEYASGFLIYERSGSLIAQRFDATAGHVTGEPTLIIGNIATSSGYRSIAASVSQNGVMVYRRGERDEVLGGPAALTWFDRGGREVKAITSPSYYRYANLSPDGRRIAVTFTADGQSFDLWQIDLRRGVPTRFTFNNDDDFWPVAWSWDARRLAFASRHRTGRAYDLFRRLADGSTADELLFESPEAKYPTGFSPDDKILLFTRDMGSEKGTDIWALPMNGNRVPFPVVSTRFNEGSAVFSPNSEWIAYMSNDTGPMQVYVEPFPPTGRRFRLSTGSGTSPMWTRGGREVVFATTEQEFMAVDITVAHQEIRAGAPHKLFAHSYFGGNWNSFVVDPTGERFLLAVPQKETYETMTVMLNWPALLRNK